MFRSILGVFILISAVSGCGQSRESSDPVQLEETTNSIDERSPLAGFDSLFTYDWTDSFDFGWHPPRHWDTVFNRTDYTRDYDRLLIVGFDVHLDSGKVWTCPERGKPISLLQTSDHTFYVFYERREISEHLRVLVLDKDLNNIKSFDIASTGGDEGYWSYRYGWFSDNHSLYHQTHVAGFSSDTSVLEKVTVEIF